MQKFNQRIAAVVAVLVVVVIATVAMAPTFELPTQTATVANAQGDVDFASVYERVAPSVVSISVRTDDPFTGGSEGTGFVLDQQGHIATNAHVVQDAVEITIEFFDGTLTAAELIGLDLESDIAVVKVDLAADRLIPVEFADSNDLFVGQPVAAIGSPFGQNWTMTTGIVSALNRTVQSLAEFRIGGVIQTDAAINPGNSGGPLVDAQGRVIGVNTQIISEVRINSGVGFAVPGNLVQRVTTDLLGDGQVEYSFIGIEANFRWGLFLIEGFGVPNDVRGVLVNGVVPGSGADRAGLQAADLSVEDLERGDFPQNYDVIVGVDGNPIRDFDTLVSYLSASTLPGDTVVLQVFRNGESVIDVPVTLGVRPTE